MKPRDVLADLGAWLEQARDEGVTEVSVSPGTMAALSAGRPRRATVPTASPASPVPVAPAPAPAPAPALDQAPPPPPPTPSRPPAVAAPPPPDMRLPARPAPPAASPADMPSRCGDLPDVAGDSLDRIAVEVAACTACDLCRSRTRTVPGQGNPTHPDILFVGEAPGHDEDQQGLAFIGPAGQLLTRMIAGMGYTRDQVFIANINKCRPPENRAPTPAEMAACLPFLQRQIALLQPRVIVALGSTAVNGLLDVPKGMGITKLRGTWLRFAGIDLMPTFHPSYLLRNEAEKRPVWDDLKNVLRRLGRSIPPVQPAR